jgi:uncharacterized protein (DUF169 family)
MATVSPEAMLEERIARTRKELEEERKKAPEEIKKANLARARKVERHLRPPTLPVGVRFWRENEEIPANAGVKSPYKYTWCQFLSLVRNNGADDRETFLVEIEDITCHIAPAILGLEEMPKELAEGKLLGQIHFITDELCADAVATIPKVPFRVKAITIGPLMDLEVTPDVVFTAITPGRTNKVMDGAMWLKGGRFVVQYGNGCGACGNGTAEPMVTDQVATIAFMCHGARRWGGFEDTELGCGVNIEKFDAWIEGMEATWLTGHSYPIAHQLASPNRETHHKQTGVKYEDEYPYCLDA